MAYINYLSIRCTKKIILPSTKNTKGLGNKLQTGPVGISSNFRNFHQWLAAGNCVNTSNFKTLKSRYLNPKGSFFGVLVRFAIPKLLKRAR